MGPYCYSVCYFIIGVEQGSEANLSQRRKTCRYERDEVWDEKEKSRTRITPFYPENKHMITKITYIIIAQNRLRNPKIFRNTDKINNAKSCLRNCAYLVPTTGPRGQYLGKIHKEKPLKTCVQSMAQKRVTTLKEIRLPDIKWGKTADIKLNVLSAGLNSFLWKIRYLAWYLTPQLYSEPRERTVLCF